MPKVFTIVSLFLSIVLHSSCSSKKVNSHELREYLNRFEKESHNYNCFIDTSKIKVRFSQLPKGTIARVFILYVPILLEVDRKWWSYANELDRLNMIRHEGGHAFLLLNHDDTKPGIMNTYLLHRSLFHKNILDEFYSKCPKHLRR